MTQALEICRKHAPGTCFPQTATAVGTLPVHLPSNVPSNVNYFVQKQFWQLHEGAFGVPLSVAEAGRIACSPRLNHTAHHALQLVLLLAPKTSQKQQKTNTP